jgi:hypothetical protein
MAMQNVKCGERNPGRLGDRRSKFWRGFGGIWRNFELRKWLISRLIPPNSSKFHSKKFFLTTDERRWGESRKRLPADCADGRRFGKSGLWWYWGRRLAGGGGHRAQGDSGKAASTLRFAAALQGVFCTVRYLLEYRPACLHDVSANCVARFPCRDLTRCGEPE